MATVFLPLSDFSRKILLTEYGGAEPLVPGRADWLSDQLRIDRSDTSFSKAALAIVSAGLLLEVPAALADRIARDGQRLGAVIHRIHIELLTRHMVSAVLMGGEAKKAMRAFYDTYQIDDDDLDEQSLYREYGRFSRNFFAKISAKSGTKSPDAVRAESRIWQGISGKQERVSNIVLNDLCNALDVRLHECRIRRVKRLSKQAHIYIWSKRGHRDWRTVGKRFKVQRSSVYRALKAVRKRIREDKRFAKAILPLLETSFVLPAPVPVTHLCEHIPPAATALSQ